MTAVLHHTDRHAGFGTWRNVIVSIFSHQLQAEHLPEIKKINLELLARYPEGLLGVVLIEPTAVGIAADLRAPTVALMSELSKHIQINCYVFNGGGAMMATVRTVVSAMIMASRPTRPIKVMNDLRSAAEWIASENARTPAPREVFNAAELLGALSNLQRQHQARVTATP